jgi:uncharacterized protein
MKTSASIKAIVLTSAIIVLVMSSCKSSQENSPKAELLVPLKCSAFKVGEVKLLDGPFKKSQDAEAKYLLSLDLERLLAPFRAEGHLKARAQSYPGWETRSLPGVALSFYLSGVSRLYRLTGEDKYLRNINYLLDELQLCQSQNNGYLLGSRGGKQAFEKLEKEGYFEGFTDWGIGCGEPYYVLEKLYSGLIDVYRISNNPKALKILVDLTTWLDRHMLHISDEDMQKIMDEEYGGMNWVLADMYVITGNKRYLAMSKRWQDDHIIVPMTKRIDVLTKKHANTQFPKMSGLAARYPYTADPSDLTGAVFFWDSVVNHRSYVTGGNSESEYLPARDSLSDTLTPFTAENCNEYNMLKLTALLYKIEPRVEYADYMERTLYNHILAAQNLEDGRVCYHLPLMPGAERYYRSLYDEFSCCVCSGMDSYTRHSEYIYAHTESDIFVNLFVNSELRWKKKGIILKQETKFPYEDLTTIKIDCEKETEMGLRIRNPYWLSGPMTVKVNGEVQNLKPLNGYFQVNRKWQKGDRLEIKLPMNLRMESMPDDNNRIALFYGPVLLAGEFEKKDAIALVKAKVAPALVPGDRPFDQWTKPVGEPLSFITTVALPKQIKLQPFFTLKTGPYSVYWQKISSKEWQQRIALDERRKENIKKLGEITFDLVSVGDDNSEQKHALTGKSTTGKGNFGILTDEVWRSAEPGGLSYEMKVPDHAPVALLCKFMGREQHETWDCQIRIDNTSLVKLKREKDDSYPVIPFENTYPIPVELTKGKTSIKVAFEVAGSRTVPRLMELRIIKR